MFTKDILFWNVDTQYDFMNKNGKLYAPGAEEIQDTLQKISTLAAKQNIQIVNTADYHHPDSAELSDQPDFIESFPPHCMAGSKGVEYITETQPQGDFFVLEWDQKYSNEQLKHAALQRNIVIHKDAFDVFTGNTNTDRLMKELEFKKVFVYGVTTNVCVDCAVKGLAERNYEVYVIEDAIKELPKIPLPYKTWDALGVKRILFADLEKHL